MHGTDPAFTPPFPGSVVRLLGPESVFRRKHGEIHPLIAERDGVPVGRVAAIVNRTHNAHHRDTVGFFGFFDCIDDVSVVRELFRAACSLLKSSGLSSIRGPYNPSINDDCGVLLEGNDRPSYVSMPWNPPSYGRLLREAGLEQVRTLYAWEVPFDKPMPERITRIVARILGRGRVTVRSIDLGRLGEELRIIHRLYNLFEDRNWGFYPIALEDLLSAAEDLRSIANPELIRFVCIDGKEVAFALALPNVNEIFHSARRSKGWLRMLEIGLRLRLQRITSSRLCLLGIEPSARDKGLSALLFYESFRSAAKYHSVTEVSWVEANNEEILEGAAIMGGRRSRTYGIFGSPLRGSLPDLLQSREILIGTEVWNGPGYGGFFRILGEGLRREGRSLSMTATQFAELRRGAAPDSVGLHRVDELHAEGLLSLALTAEDGPPSPGGATPDSEFPLLARVNGLLLGGGDVSVVTDDAALRMRLRDSSRQIVALRDGVTPGLLRLASGRDFMTPFPA